VIRISGDRPGGFSWQKVSDYIGAAALPDELPKAQWLLGDWGYDADWLRDALREKGVKSSISGQKIAQRAHQIRQATLQAP